VKYKPIHQERGVLINQWTSQLLVFQQTAGISSSYLG